MKMVIFCLLIILGSYLNAQELPPFANITSIDFRGSGCDAESARVSITPDLQYFSILYDRFSAEVGVGSVNPQSKRDNKNCIIVVKFDLPAGWSFQFEEVEYRGFVSLSNSQSVAQQNISVDTPAGKMKDFNSNNMRGPLMDNYSVIFKNQIEMMDPAQNPQVRGLGKMRPDGKDKNDPPGRKKHLRKGDLFECSERVQNATLRIRSRISVSNQGDSTNANVKLIVDSTDASFKQKLKINWNRCLRD